MKNVHNMIEFGMVQAIGEGLEMLERYDSDLDLADVFHNWAHGSVIQGWLVELMEKALRSRHHLSGLEPHVQDTGEQRWGIEYALQNDIPVPLPAQAVWVSTSHETRPGHGPRRSPCCAMNTAGTRSRARRDRREPVTRSG